jgi:hypothetical protein
MNEWPTGVFRESARQVAPESWVPNPQPAAPTCQGLRLRRDWGARSEYQMSEKPTPEEPLVDLYVDKGKLVAKKASSSFR